MMPFEILERGAEMRKRLTGKPCVYCGDPATTSDHVASRKFFLVRHRANLPQVPACQKCNGEKAALENFLTTVLPFAGRYSHAHENLSTMVERRLAGNMKLTRSIARAMRQVWVRDASGLFRGTIEIPFDGAQLEALCVFMAKGLLFHHWGTLLSRDDDEVQVHTLVPVIERIYDAAFNLAAPKGVTQNLGEGTIIYRGSQGGDNPSVSVWRFSFFKSPGQAAAGKLDEEIVDVGVMTGPKKVFSSADTRARWHAGLGAQS